MESYRTTETFDNGTLENLDKISANHPIEKVGKILRKNMSAMKKQIKDVIPIDEIKKAISNLNNIILSAPLNLIDSYSNKYSSNVYVKGRSSNNRIF